MARHTPNVVLGEKSSTSCAIASWRGDLHVAWTGSDMRLNTMSSPDCRHFVAKRTLRHRSSTTETTRRNRVVSAGVSAGVYDSETTTTTVPLAPALAATTTGVHLAWTGTDRRLNVWGPGLGAAGHVVLPERSPHPPALAAWGPDVVLAWTGTDRHLNVIHTRDGSWVRPRRLDETSPCAPAIAAAGRELVVAWTGTDRHVNVLRTRDGAWDRPRRLRETSSNAPALCAAGSGFVLAWTGTDRHLDLLDLRPAGGSAVRLRATSSHSPALCTHLGALIVAWTGTDRRLNVARRRLPARGV